MKLIQKLSVIMSTSEIKTIRLLCSSMFLSKLKYVLLKGYYVVIENIKIVGNTINIIPPISE